MPRVLVTGGAGYVGSHCARRLADAGFEVVTYDDLSQGYEAAVQGELVEGDLRDGARLRGVLKRGFDAVLHFAALMSVPDSMKDPLGYWSVNVAGTLELLLAMRDTRTSHVVFSSTCAVYGVPERVPMDEGLPLAPISPYGETKAQVERLLAAARHADGIRSASLRYFNACGASEDGWLGEAHVPEQHLVPVALDAAATGRSMTVFGTDHPTPDGTCIRDYVHVLDLAEAHLLAVRHLIDGGYGGVWNLGTGRGNSVAEVLATVERVTGRTLPRTYGPRREGDPPALVADPTKVARDLGWKARYGLEDAVRTAWAWHRNPRYGPRHTT